MSVKSEDSGRRSVQVDVEVPGLPDAARDEPWRMISVRAEGRGGVEPEQERDGEEIAPVRVGPDDLEPDTLRAVIESFVLREGTDYGVHEVSLDEKVAQVLMHLRRGEAHITFDPATETVNVVVTGAIAVSGRP